MSSSPAVSVVIPAYNASAHIEQAVDSVLKQSICDFEVIVVDDGSTDDTASRLAQYGSRIRYIFQENQERSAARNNGILAANGRYVAFLDADDCWHPERLAKQLAFVAQRPDVALVYGWAQCFFESRLLPLILGKDFATTDGREVFSGLSLGKSLPTLTILADRAAVIAAGLFDPRLSIGEDWDLWLRLSLRHKVGLVPEILAYYRLTGKFLPTAMARVNVPDSRVRSVQRVFEEARRLPQLDLPAELEPQALAQAWWRGCLIHYAVGDFRAGKERLAQSIEHDPVFHFRRTDSWIESLIAFAAYLHDFNTPRSEAEGFVKSFFDHLPGSAQVLRRRRRAVLGRLRAGYAFRMNEEGELELESRQIMREALRTYPPLMRNLGAVSIAIRNSWIDRRRLIRIANKSLLWR